MSVVKTISLFVFPLAVLLGSCTSEGKTNALKGWEDIGKSQPDTVVVPQEPADTVFFRTRGLVMGWSEVSNASVLDYIDIAERTGLNTFSIYNAPFGTEVWTEFTDKCKDKGISIEYEEHMMSFLLPRSLFESHPEYFRMDNSGVRVSDANGCPSSEGALSEVYRNAIDIAKRYSPSNHKYYYWLDDGGDVCHCAKCAGLNASDQALIFENTVIKALKTIDPEARLAHLCYHNTLEPPKSVSPEEDIFLEFAPFYRRWDEPLANTWVMGRDGKTTHAEYLRQLKANLKVFPAETAQVLEYWMDDSLFSEWNTDKLVEVPWNKAVFLSDLKTYASHGIHNIMCYCAYVGPAYVQKFGFPYFIEEYAQGLKDYEQD